MLLLNKHELVSERELDDVLDHVFELNPDTPVVKCRGKNGVDFNLLTGIGTQLFSSLDSHSSEIQLDPDIELLEVSAPPPIGF